jgi:integrase
MTVSNARYRHLEIRYRQKGRDMAELKEIQVRQAKLADGQKRKKLADGGGMYLLVTPTGKYWRLDYRFAGKRKTLALGVYDDVSLKRARDKRHEARVSLDKKIDPAMQKKATKKAEANSFEAVAREWYEKQQPTWKPNHARTVISRLERDVFPWLGSTPVADIEAPALLTLLKRIEKRGAIETAHRIKSICGQVFRYAIATGRAQRDPVPDLRGALRPVKQGSMATITNPKRVGELMRAIQSFKGTFQVQCALQIAPYVFVRPTELRHAEWTEFDLDAAQWNIPAEKMKMGRPHIVPLASQVVAILRELQPFSGGDKYLFSGRDKTRPMSDGTINACLRRLSFGSNEIVGHGFRGMASTLLHGQGWKSDIIERQLAHIEGNSVKAAYNHAEYLPERIKLMQHWADYLDGLRDGADVININRRQA